MSLDVYLEVPAEGCPCNGVCPCHEGQDSANTVYDANITHNLGRMAGEAGIYQHLWRPEEVGVTTAEQLIGPLSEGLVRLEKDRAGFEKFNPSNRWGDYDGLVRFVRGYLEACRAHPSAKVRVSR